MNLIYHTRMGTSKPTLKRLISYITTVGNNTTIIKQKELPKKQYMLDIDVKFGIDINNQIINAFIF